MKRHRERTPRYPGRDAYGIPLIGTDEAQTMVIEFFSAARKARMSPHKFLDNIRLSNLGYTSSVDSLIDIFADGRTTPNFEYGIRVGTTIGYILISIAERERLKSDFRKLKSLQEFFDQYHTEFRSIELEAFRLEKQRDELRQNLLSSRQELKRLKRDYSSLKKKTLKKAKNKN